MWPRPIGMSRSRVCLEAQHRGLIVNRSYDNEDEDGSGGVQEEHTQVHCGHHLEATELWRTHSALHTHRHALLKRQRLRRPRNSAMKYVLWEWRSQEVHGLQTCECWESVRPHIIFVFFLFFFLSKWYRSWKLNKVSSVTHNILHYSETAVILEY